MVSIDERIGLFSRLTRSRPFNPPPENDTDETYAKKLAGSGIDILAEIVTRLRTQDVVTFYDIGCGNGFAADGDTGIFEAVRNRLGPTEQGLVDKLFYFGIDLLKPEGTEGPRKRLITYDIERFGDLARNLPRIDVGVSLWSFPYFERKMEALEALAHHLSPGGVLVICPFLEDRTIMYNEGNSPVNSLGVYTHCFDAHKQGNSLIVRGNKNPVGNVVSFVGGEVVSNCRDAFNGRGYAHITSRYVTLNSQLSF